MRNAKQSWPRAEGVESTTRSFRDVFDKNGEHSSFELSAPFKLKRLGQILGILKRKFVVASKRLILLSQPLVMNHLTSHI